MLLLHVQSHDCVYHLSDYLFRVVMMDVREIKFGNEAYTLVPRRSILWRELFAVYIMRTSMTLVPYKLRSPSAES